MQTAEVKEIADRMLKPMRKAAKGERHAEPDNLALAELLASIAINLARIADAKDRR